GAGEALRIVRIEPSYEILQPEAPARGPAPPPAVSPAPRAFDRTILEALIDSTPDAVLLISGTGTILFANATCTDLLGYKFEELVGQPIELLVPPEVRAGHPARRAAYQPETSRRPMARLP